jgi:hypothetical protein
MSALAEEGLREIEELSSSSGYSFETYIERLQNVRGEAETSEKVGAMAMDMEARMLALYQLAALKAKKADDIGQIQKIWSRPHFIFETGFMLISKLVSGGDQNPYVAHLLNTIVKLRTQVRWLYDLHADQ